MRVLTPDVTSFKKPDDLRPLVSGTGPCLTAYLSLNADAVGEGNEKRNQLRWKELLRSIEPKAGQFGQAGRELLDSIRNWDDIRDAMPRDGARDKSIAVLRSEDAFRIVVLSRKAADRAVLGPQFFIRPLLAELMVSAEFYILALSEKNTRLLRCTFNSSEQIPLPSDIKSDFEAWMNEAKPDHTLVYNAMTSPSQGQAGPSALAPTGSDKEKKDEYLSHFFKQIDRGVMEVLKGNSAPLVLCSVEYQIPIYRQVNHYPHLVEDDVRGAPNSLKSGEMHARAIEALERAYQKTIQEAVAEWNHRVGGGASSRLKEVVVAAHDGRVMTLLLSDSAEQTGVYDEASDSVKGRETGGPNDEDLLNEAAVQTILHAGNVLVVPHSKMPNGAPAAAVFRY